MLKLFFLWDVFVEEGSAQPKPYTTEDYVRITEDQAKAFVSEEQRKGALSLLFNFLARSDVLRAYGCSMDSFSHVHVDHIWQPLKLLLGEARLL